jgi:hypothetical protein
MICSLKVTLGWLILAMVCASCASISRQDKSVASISRPDKSVRGEFPKPCSIQMPVLPSHAVYYDEQGNVISHTVGGITTALVEDMYKTDKLKNRLCQAEPAGPAHCGASGYCSRPYGGFHVCVPC